jgi:hypothetical protein
LRCVLRQNYRQQNDAILFFSSAAQGEHMFPETAHTSWQPQ